MTEFEEIICDFMLINGFITLLFLACHDLFASFCQLRNASSEAATTRGEEGSEVHMSHIPARKIKLWRVETGRA